MKNQLPLTWETPNGLQSGFWALPRPLTKHWGSGKVLERLTEAFGKPDALFGWTDGPTGGAMAIDRQTGYDWIKLPFEDNHFSFGYYDPPYFKDKEERISCLFKKESQEVWRVCRKLAILHEFVYPKAWFSNANRIGMVAVTMGPLRRIRILNVFEKTA